MFTIVRYISRKIANLSTSINVTVTLLGLDNSGKTSLFNDLRRHVKQDVVSVQPTYGKNVLDMKLKKAVLNIQDVGGSAGFRPLWKRYFAETDIIMYFVDASVNEREKLEESKKELEKIVNNSDLQNVVFCICANKMDKVNDKSIIKNAKELESFFNLNELLHGHLWTCIETRAGSSEEEMFYSSKQKNRQMKAMTNEEIQKEEDLKASFPIHDHFGVVGILAFVEKCLQDTRMKLRLKQTAKSKKKK